MVGTGHNILRFGRETLIWVVFRAATWSVRLDEFRAWRPVAQLPKPTPFAVFRKGFQLARWGNDADGTSGIKR